MVDKKPPFFGIRILDEIPFREIKPLIDLEALFSGRWQFRKGVDASEWENLKKEKAVPILERMISRCEALNILVPKIVYGYFHCKRIGNGLVVEGEGKDYRFDFPRERKTPNRCIADFFPEGFIAIQLVTVGDGTDRVATDLFKRNEYSEAFFLKGLAAEAAEALACFGHDYIRKEIDAPEDVGERFSPGYPVFPDILDQKKIQSILKPERIGVTVSRTGMLIPEYSTSAIISVDPKASHFHI